MPPDPAGPRIVMQLCPLRGSAPFPQLWSDLSSGRVPFLKKNKQNQNHFIYINYKKKKITLLLTEKNLLLKTWLGSNTWVLLLARSPCRTLPALCRAGGAAGPRPHSVAHEGVRSTARGGMEGARAQRRWLSPGGKGGTAKRRAKGDTGWGGGRHPGWPGRGQRAPARGSVWREREVQGGSVQVKRERQRGLARGSGALRRGWVRGMGDVRRGSVWVTGGLSPRLRSRDWGRSPWLGAWDRGCVMWLSARGG